MSIVRRSSGPRLARCMHNAHRHNRRADTQDGGPYLSAPLGKKQRPAFRSMEEQVPSLTPVDGDSNAVSAHERNVEAMQRSRDVADASSVSAETPAAPSSELRANVIRAGID